MRDVQAPNLARLVLEKHHARGQGHADSAAAIAGAARAATASAATATAAALSTDTRKLEPQAVFEGLLRWLRAATVHSRQSPKGRAGMVRELLEVDDGLAASAEGSQHACLARARVAANEYHPRRTNAAASAAAAAAASAAAAAGKKGEAVTAQRLIAASKNKAVDAEEPSKPGNALAAQAAARAQDA